MRRLIAAAIVAGIAVISVSSCGSDPYCDEIEDNKSTLDNFGNEKTMDAYAEDAKELREVAKTAPDDVASDWKTLAEVTQGVLDAQKEAGIKLENMKDEDELGELSEDELKELNDAYNRFNDTSDERSTVVKNVKQECEITLE